MLRRIPRRQVDVGFLVVSPSEDGDSALEGTTFSSLQSQFDSDASTLGFGVCLSNGKFYHRDDSHPLLTAEDLDALREAGSSIEIRLFLDFHLHTLTVWGLQAGSGLPLFRQTCSVPSFALDQPLSLALSLSEKGSSGEILYTSSTPLVVD